MEGKLAREACDSASPAMYCSEAVARSAASYSSVPNDPGVPLRFTPGFMLSPRFAGSIQLYFGIIGFRNVAKLAILT
jgi:hypothetical protein